MRAHHQVKSANYSQLVRNKTYDLSPEYKARIGKTHDQALETDVEYISLGQNSSVNVTYESVFTNMERIAHLYRHSSWEDLFGRLTTQEPIHSENCTLGVISPYSRHLEWITVHCNRKHNQSVLICKLNTSAEKQNYDCNRVGVLNIDLSYYNILTIDGQVSYRKRILDARTSGLCITNKTLSCNYTALNTDSMPWSYVDAIHRSLCKASSFSIWQKFAQSGIALSPQICYRCLQTNQTSTMKSIIVENNTILHPSGLIPQDMCPRGMLQWHDGHCVSEIHLLQGEQLSSGNSPITLCESDKEKCDCGPHTLQCRKGVCIPWHMIVDVIVVNGNITIEHDSISGMEVLLCDFFVQNEHKGHLQLHTLDQYNISNLNTFTCNTSLLDIDVRLPDGLMQNNDIIQCVAGKPGCYRSKYRCTYDHDQSGHLRYCQNGDHLKSCSSHFCKSMFKCPHSYCVPVHKLCDSVHDCPNGEDELECNALEPISCPGFVRCEKGQCIHFDQVCDGKIDCPLGDDEVNCNQALCLDGCECFATSMACGMLGENHTHHINVTGFHSLQVRVNVFPVLSNAELMKNLDVSKGNISIIDQNALGFSFRKLLILDISNNQIFIVKSFSFIGLENLKFLNINGNPLKEIEDSAMIGLHHLTVLDFSRLRLTHVRPNSLKGLSSLQFLNIAHNKFERLSFKPFHYLPALKKLNISHNPIIYMNLNGHRKKLYQVISDNVHICCLHNSFKCSTKTCPINLLQANMYYLSTFSCFVGALGIARVIIFFVISHNNIRRRSLPNLLTLCYEAILSLQPAFVILNDLLSPENQIRTHSDVTHLICMTLAFVQMSAAAQFIAIRTVQIYTLFQLTRISHGHYKAKKNSKYLVIGVFCATCIVCSVPLMLDNNLPIMGGMCTYMVFNTFSGKLAVYVILSLNMLASLVTCFMYAVILATILESRKRVIKLGGNISGTGSKYPWLPMMKSVLYLCLLVFWMVQLSTTIDSQVWLVISIAVNFIPSMIHILTTLCSWLLKFIIKLTVRIFISNVD